MTTLATRSCPPRVTCKMDMMRTNLPVVLLVLPFIMTLALVPAATTIPSVYLNVTMVLLITLGILIALVLGLAYTLAIMAWLFLPLVSLASLVRSAAGLAHVVVSYMLLILVTLETLIIFASSLVVMLMPAPRMPALLISLALSLSPLLPTLLACMISDQALLAGTLAFAHTPPAALSPLIALTPWRT